MVPRLTSAEVEAAAKALYEANPVPKPLWEQLGEATKDTWRDEVRDPEGCARAAKQRLRIAVRDNQVEESLRRASIRSIHAGAVPAKQQDPKERHEKHR